MSALRPGRRGPRLSLAIFWRPERLAPRTWSRSGSDREVLRGLFADVREVTTLSNAAGIDNPEAGRSVYVCREPIVTLEDAWDDLELFTA